MAENTTESPEPLTTQQSLLRTVDCLQRLFALLLALTVTEAFKRWMFTQKNETHPDTLDVILQISFLPDLLTIIFTVIPVYHGVHRHLDRAYAKPRKVEHKASLQMRFAADMLLSWISFAFIFSLQVCMGTERLFPLLFASTIFINVLWGLLLPKRGKDSYVFWWAGLNVVFLSFLIVLTVDNHLEHNWRHWLVTLLAFVRSILDYLICWELYFPFQTTNDEPNNSDIELLF